MQTRWTPKSRDLSNPMWVKRKEESGSHYAKRGVQIYPTAPDNKLLAPTLLLLLLDLTSHWIQSEHITNGVSIRDSFKFFAYGIPPFGNVKGGHEVLGRWKPGDLWRRLTGQLCRGWLPVAKHGTMIRGEKSTFLVGRKSKESLCSFSGKCWHFNYFLFALELHLRIGSELEK